jgi:AraC-like DNA-binding protein
MDPLSDVLSLLRLRTYTAGGFDAGGAWSLAFGPHDGIKCQAVVAGECWLAMEGVADPVHVGSGDCFLLPLGRPFRLATDLALPSADATTLFPTTPSGGIVAYNGGGDFLSVGGHFALAGSHAGLLLSVLPPIVHIRREADKATLHWCLERMRQELREPQPGGFLIAQQLATTLLIQALRLHLAERAEGGAGWLSALADRQMAAAITAMHADPARRWTLQSLAETAGMSRTTFATRFKETVAVSPMDYLTRWRMLLAADRLANSSSPVSAVALSLGYESESAFSTAFKRVMGCPPRQYGRRRTPATFARRERDAPAQPHRDADEFAGDGGGAFTPRTRAHPH